MSGGLRRWGVEGSADGDFRRVGR